MLAMGISCQSPAQLFDQSVDLLGTVEPVLAQQGRDLGIDDAEVPLLVRRLLGHEVAVSDLEAGSEVLVVTDALVERRQVPVNPVHKIQVDVRFEQVVPELSGAVRGLKRLEREPAAERVVDNCQ